jgi:SAM-dependent methyltransferase
MRLRPPPEVFLLGAMRSGTTFLQRALSAHPCIVPTLVKETQFFSLHWPKGRSAYHEHLPRRGPQWVYAIAGKRRPLVLDSSPYYLFHPQAPIRLRQLLGPSIKAIVLLREPGERAWSHYRLNLAYGREHLGFLDALAREEERLAGEDERLAAGREVLDAPHQLLSYTARGKYAEQLQRWWTQIPREQFLLLKSTELFDDPEATLDRVWRFLDLPPVAVPNDLNRNAAPDFPLPLRAREELDRIYEAPNRALFHLTGISFGRTAIPLPDDEFMPAYRARTDARVLEDPKAAIGGMWEEIGRLQFDYLRNDGLRPDHSMLDIGCGTLRGGRHFIAWLDSGKYTGFEVSSNALAEGSRLMQQEGLAGKHASLVLNAGMGLRFEEFKGTFDVLLAQSVFTHLTGPRIEECLANVGRIMHASSRFYFTFLPSSAPSQFGTENFRYPLAFFAAAADRYGFELDARDDYAHPRGQRMVVLKLKSYCHQ